MNGRDSFLCLRLGPKDLFVMLTQMFSCGTKK